MQLLCLILVGILNFSVCVALGKARNRLGLGTALGLLPFWGMLLMMLFPVRREGESYDMGRPVAGTPSPRWWRSLVQVAQVKDNHLYRYYPVRGVLKTRRLVVVALIDEDHYVAKTRGTGEERFFLLFDPLGKYVAGDEVEEGFYLCKGREMTAYGGVRVLLRQTPEKFEELTHLAVA